MRPQRWRCVSASAALRTETTQLSDSIGRTFVAPSSTAFSTVQSMRAPLLTHAARISGRRRGAAWRTGPSRRSSSRPSRRSARVSPAAQGSLAHSRKMAVAPAPSKSSTESPRPNRSTVTRWRAASRGRGRLSDSTSSVLANCLCMGELAIGNWRLEIAARAPHFFKRASRILRNCSDFFAKSRISG